MNKNILIIALSALFLLGSIVYDFTQKRAFNKTVEYVKKQKSEISTVAALQDLWGAKGIISKLKRALNAVPPQKRAISQIKRSKAKIALQNLTDKELNRVLSKLAMLPIQFKNLNVERNGENYSMECLCVW